MPGGTGHRLTEFLRVNTRTAIGQKFLPIVSQTTELVSLARKYEAVAGKAAGMGLMAKEDAELNGDVTAKAPDGLYLMIGEKEKKIRRDPAATGSAILKQVFGG